MTGGVAVAADHPGAEATAERMGALFDAHHRRVYALARRLSRSGDEARDLVQETFLRAVRSPASVPSGASAEEAWLVRVLVNICRDRWRRAATRRRIDGTHGCLQPQAPPDPERALVAHAIVWRALDALPPRRRAVLVLHELEGMPVPAIARTLGVVAVTVRWHLAMGRRDLARLVRGEGVT
jgi:RNA polymerase sigma-70 factor (ECF subfamily)